MRSKILSVIYCIATMLIINSITVLANEFEGYSRLEKQLLQMQQKLNELENKSVEEKSIEIPEIFKDLVIGGGITFIVQSAQNANCTNEKYNGTTPTVASYSVDLGFSKNLSKHDKVFLHLETGQGTIDDQLLLYSYVNFDGDKSDAIISITEAWYEHYFGDSGFGFNIGKLDPTTALDENNFANDETTQFLSCLFRNSANIDTTIDNSFGAQVFYETKFIDLSLQYVLNTKEFTDITRDAFVSAQATIKPNFIDKLEGNYRFYTWTSTSAHKKWGDLSNKDENNYGCGISFDQQLSQNIGAFARYGWENQEVYYEELGYSLSQSWSIGLQFQFAGLAKADTIGIAYGQIIPSNDYKTYKNVIGKTENHLEIYYKCNVYDFLSITPDFQMIENPFGGDSLVDTSTIYVGGIRLQVDF